MFENFRSRYFTTSDRENIHFLINFNPSAPQKKPVLVFNYGLVCSMLHWKPQIEYFNQKNFPILAYDYRAHFSSSGRDKLENLTFDRMALDLKELLAFLQIENPVLLGHSMGVNLCLHFEVLYPHISKEVIVISGTALDVSHVLMNTEFNKLLLPFLYSLDKKYPDGFSTMWKLINFNPLVHQIIRFLGFNYKKVSTQFVRDYLYKVYELGPEVFFKLIHEMKTSFLLPNLPQIHKPVLIMAGNKDLVVPFETQKLLGLYIKDSTFKEIKDGSHVPQIDFPELINSEIENFVLRHDP